MDNAKAPDLGNGPYGVEHDADTGFYYLTCNGSRVDDKGGPYPLGKTAYKRARQLNDEHADAVTTRPAKPDLGDLETKDKTPTPPVSAPADPGDPETFPTVAEIEKAQGRKASRSGKKAAPKPAKAAKRPVRETRAETKPENLVTFTGTREEWLNAFTEAARPSFAEVGFPLPDKVHVSVGFPSLGARKFIGECWRPEASPDGASHVFISPILGGDETARIADVLTHELCHAVTPGDKHGPKFKQVARALGLEGKLTATTAGEAWFLWAQPILDKLGPIPHVRLDPSKSGRKKQTTRLLKGECQACGFTVRLTAKWVNAAQGELQCPDSLCGGFLNVELSGGGEGE